MRLSDVRHQDRALSVLRRALRSGRTHHAYLFDGPEGVGKEMAARGLAARLLCHAPGEPDADACGTCPSCRLLTSDSHPDFHLIHRGLHKVHPDRSIRASKGLFLAVDLIRTFVIEPAASTPTVSNRRVFVIRDAERMNAGAQNALLKTLEEPPAHVALILVTASAERLLPTIRSRCQQIVFNLLPPAFVAEQLVEQTGADPEEARTVSRLAGGRLGAALRWQQTGILTALDDVLDCLTDAAESGPAQFAPRMLEIADNVGSRSAREVETDENEAERNAAKELSTDALRDALKLVLMLVAAVYRDGLAAATGADAARHLPARRQVIDSLVAGLDPEALQDRIRAVAYAEHMLDRNAFPQMTCERLCSAITGTVPVV